MADQAAELKRDILMRLLQGAQRPQPRSFYDPPIRGSDFGSAAAYAAPGQERFASDMRGSLGVTPTNESRAAAMLDQSQYARHPDAAEAIRNAVTGLRDVPPDDGPFAAIRKLLFR